ncbi:HEAT repeat domain-containing protein [Nocardia sp. NEAU-G5]|uniref:HEAT repeat domain-containing protein n=1 Tax=Nocardia albiluteola TaxID=2842303 RepID=A0ABS6AQ51_9NOCA|nr:HEAT repeat domain-containing protein [Nocardia albiluteola]MBU3060141.1 HEAT repeat domain-containing protein [Nocardia albiluteola]
MPVMPSYVLSHQWLRELRRGGQRLIVAVDFRIRDDERVLVGHYSAGQVEMRVAEAVSVILHAEDARGYEILVPRAIAPAELHRVRHVRQVTGWRYRPNAHGQRPCACPVCLGRGEFKAADLRRRFATEPPELTKPQLLARLHNPDCDDDLIDALCGLGRKSRGDVADVAPFVDHPNPDVRYVLALALRSYRGGEARRLLVRLAADTDPDVRDVAT